MHMENVVEAPYGVDLYSNVHMETDSDNEQEEDEDEEDEEEEDEEEDENVNVNDGKEPWTIGQGEMVNLSADNVDTMGDNQPIVLPE
jgi:hypothetical protein